MKVFGRFPFLVAALVIGGCASEVSSVAPETDGIASVETTREEGQRQVDSSSQDAILADGVVTFVEYERAVMDMASCLTGLGYSTRISEELGGYELGIELVVSDGTDPETVAQEQSDYRYCEESYLNRVNARYYEDYLGKVRKQWFAAQAECLLERGYDSPGGFPGFTTGDPETDRELWEACLYPEGWDDEFR